MKKLIVCNLSGILFEWKYKFLLKKTAYFIDPSGSPDTYYGKEVHPISILKQENLEDCLVIVVIDEQSKAKVDAVIERLEEIGLKAGINYYTSHQLQDRHFILDIVDACNLKCVTCPRGHEDPPNTSDRISFDLFKKIIDKAAEQLYGTIWLYNWGEPLLHPNLGEFVKYTKSAGIDNILLSSNLSLRNIDNLFEALLNGLSYIRVSTSGYKKETHEINHVGSDIELVKSNLVKLSEFMEQNNIDKNRVILRYLRFSYNKDEAALSEQFAKKLGFQFEEIQGLGNPQDFDAYYRAQEMKLDYMQPLDYYNFEDTCSVLLNDMVVDSRGDLYLCCARQYLPALKLGKYLDLTEKEILVRKITHPNCLICSFKKDNKYVIKAGLKELYFEGLIK